MGAEFTKTAHLSSREWLITVALGVIALPLGVFMRFIPVKVRVPTTRAPAALVLRVCFSYIVLQTSAVYVNPAKKSFQGGLLWRLFAPRPFLRILACELRLREELISIQHPQQATPRKILVYAHNKIFLGGVRIPSLQEAVCRLCVGGGGESSTDRFYSYSYSYREEQPVFCMT